MHIDKLILGDYQTNCYIIRPSEKVRACAIIDTGLEPRSILATLKQKDLNPEAVILTHGHADHIAAIPFLKQEYPEIEVLIHKADAQMLEDPKKNLSVLAGANITAGSATTEIEDEPELEYAGLKLQVLHTPGHTPGGICLYSKRHSLIFTGDTLFAGSIGRTDFPGYDQQNCQKQLIDSIREKILSISENTNVYPGHGPATTIRNEKKYNPYCQAEAI